MTVGNFASFVGQDALKEQVRSRMRVAMKIGQPIPHMLLCGPPEMGKATFAHAIAQEMGVRVNVLPCSRTTTKLDYIGLFANVQSNEIVIAEEPSGLGIEVQALLAEALAHQTMTIQFGVGSEARSVVMQLQPFTLIATASKSWGLPAAFRRWFLVLDFEPYALSEVAQILSVLAPNEGFALEEDAAILIAAHCQGTPGYADVLLKRIRRHYESGFLVSKELATLFLDLLGFNHREETNITLADRVRTMSGVEFEQFVAHLFGGLGYSAELTPTSGDHGVDILIRKSGQTSAVQCKRWEDPVGEPVVRDFLGSMVGAGVAFGYIAATSVFTPQAQEFAQKHGIRLLDLDALIEMAGPR
jgi:Holliday junction resolvasome RuvABC ATP-dependent DNA helicase subunit